MPKIPDKIYLQWFGTDEPQSASDGEVCEEEVSWCTDQIWNNDIEYIRVKRATAKSHLLERLVGNQSEHD